MPDDKKRPMLKTSAKKDEKYKETPDSGAKKTRKTASEMNAEDEGTERSKKLGKGMAEGMSYAMRSTTRARKMGK